MVEGQKGMAKVNTPEIRQSQIKGFVRLQKKQGGIIPSKLDPASTVLVETSGYVYCMKVVDSPSGRRFLLDTGSPMCKDRHVIIHIQAHSSKLKYNMEDWIGRDMRLILKFTDGTSVMIGDVKGASITGQRDDGSEYTYDFWQETNLP
jgi:hypothetical protein